MKKLMMDLETKSDIDIAKSGVYRYADSPYFDILLFAYSVDDAPVQVVDLASGERLPEEILNALTTAFRSTPSTPVLNGSACQSGCGETIRNVSSPTAHRRMPAATTSARTHGDARWWQLPIWACR